MVLDMLELLQFKKKQKKTPLCQHMTGVKRSLPSYQLTDIRRIADRFNKNMATLWNFMGKQLNSPCLAWISYFLPAAVLAEKVELSETPQDSASVFFMSAYLVGSCIHRTDRKISVLGCNQSNQAPIVSRWFMNEKASESCVINYLSGSVGPEPPDILKLKPGDF